MSYIGVSFFIALPRRTCTERVSHRNLLLLLLLLLLLFGPKRDENGEWRRLHDEELHSLYRSPNTVRVIQFRRLRWAGHVARMEEDRSAFKI